MWKSSRGVSARLRRCCVAKYQQALIHSRRKLSTQAPDSRSSFKLGKWILGTGLTGFTGVIGYAWYDPSVKNAIEQNIPYSKEALKPIFDMLPEKVTLPSLPPYIKQYLPWSTKEEPAPQEAPKPVKKILKLPDPEEIKKKEAAEKKLAMAKKAEEEKRLETEKELKKKKEAAKHEERALETARQKAEVERQLKEKQAVEAAENEALVLIVTTAMKNAKEAAAKANESMGKRVEAVKQHAKFLKNAMEDASAVLEKDSQWQAVASAYEIRQAVTNECEKKVMNARLQLEKLRKTLDDGFSNTVTKHNAQLIDGQELFNNISHSLNISSSEVSRAESEGKMAEKYKHLVDQSREKFRRELESIVPNVKLGDKQSKKMSEEDLNSLIVHAHTRIDQLQKQLAKQVALEQERFQEAVCEQRADDARMADIRLNEELDYAKKQFEIEKEKLLRKSAIQFEEDLRSHLARQAAAHSCHLKDALEVHEKELETEFDKRLNMKILEERATFQTEMSGWIGRLKGIEAAVEARAETEKLAKQAQELWLACVALNGVIRQGRKNILSNENQLKPLKKEIRTVTDAGQNHPFVTTILNSIPAVAIERGVWTEDALKERFVKVKKVCKNVAMIEAPGASLFKYFLSYLQSFLIFEAAYIKIEKDPINVEELTTFAILANADHYLEKGDIERAVRLMNQLHGQSRYVASDWLQEAKLFLETRQAAEALIAFAAARGLGQLF
ncbi:MICOS complex subunit Mic60 [Octopus bimaculoides]|uniref:MICOS complex subunit MIC60 n=1 Tax=Octopus bimaculoides TaxID=37653 RepID=A0A0L8HC75_OCTBM|nr:MICOS complex subunit Mic60 [Octopus bimaculoides]|eukprot:XP_014773687.1 PREDICTED: MICOS complex subunit Mic60-like [Octopus bimaculoides]